MRRLRYDCAVIETKPHLSPSQLHARWGFHPESIRRMVREGRLPALRIGNRLRVALADVEAHETAHRVSYQPQRSP